MTLTEALPVWATRLTTELDEADRRARSLAAMLTSSQLNWRPRSDAWSIGQCLEHLAIGNELYLAAIEASLKNHVRTGAVQEISLGAPSRWFIRSYIAPSERAKRANAPRKTTPAPKASPDVLDRFLRGNANAREIIRRAAYHDVNRIRFRNPFIPVIRFTVGTGLEIVSKHERRHLLQAERVRARPEFPA